MLIKTRSGESFWVYTPAEVLEIRHSFLSENKYDHNRPLTEDVKTEIEKVIKVHGWHYYDSALELSFISTNCLVGRYDFKFGHDFMISSGHIPEFIRNKEKDIHRFLEYTVQILTAFGWVVSQKEDPNWYYLAFAPMQALTPEAIELEIKQRVNQMACQALKVVNAGLQNRTEVFYDIELGFPESYRPDDFELICNRLSELLSPSWTLHVLPTKLGFTIKTSTP